MKRSIFLFVLFGSVGLFTGVSVSAKPGRCLLVIDGKTYISGRCDVDIYTDGTGSFQITENRKNGAYFAQVLVDRPNVATGYWNAERGANHAHDPLGELKRKGACWENKKARVCAWK